MLLQLDMRALIIIYCYYYYLLYSFFSLYFFSYCCKASLLLFLALDHDRCLMKVESIFIQCHKLFRRKAICKFKS